MNMITMEEYPEVLEQARLAVSWTIGGYENSVIDGHMTKEDMPSLEELQDEVYDTWMHTTYYADGVSPGPLPCIIANPDPVLYKAMVALAFAELYINHQLDWMA